MIVAIARVIQDDGSADICVVDLDKVPETNPFRLKVEGGVACEHKICGIKCSEYEDDDEDEFYHAQVEPPCQIDDVVVLHICY